MKYLGTIFGKDLLLDTDEEAIKIAAAKYYKQMRQDQLELQELKMKTEMRMLYRPGFIKKWFSML